MDTARPTFAPGAELAGYRIESIAGRGGMGIVYRATQLALGRSVALKLLTAQHATDEGFRERFRREWETAAAIDHPNVIPLYEAGESADGHLFIAMRFVDGVDLAELSARSGPMRADRAVRLVTQIAAALDAAHARGLVHRDIKPANVLVGEGDHVYLTDFGLSRETSSTRLTRTGLFVGSTDYAAPEQVRGEATDARTDVYALGCVLYQLLTATVPFARSGDMAKMYAHISEPPPLVSDLRPDLPEFDAVVERAMAKAPGDRFQSASELARAITRGGSRPGWDTAPVGLAALTPAVTPPASWADATRPAAADGRAVAVPTPSAAAGGRPPVSRPAAADGRAVPSAPPARGAAVQPSAASPSGTASGWAAGPFGTANGAAVAAPPAGVGAPAGAVPPSAPGKSAPSRAPLAAIAGSRAAGFATTSNPGLPVVADAPGPVSVAAGLAPVAAAPPVVPAFAAATPPAAAAAAPAFDAAAPAAAPPVVPAFVAAAHASAVPSFATAAPVGADSFSPSGNVRVLTSDASSPRVSPWPRHGRIAAGISLPVALVAGLAVAVIAAVGGGEQPAPAPRAVATATATPTPTVVAAKATATIEVGKGPDGVAVSGGQVFVVNHGDGTLSTIDPATNEAGAAVQVGTRPDHVAAGKGVTWVGTAGDDTVTRFENGEQTASVDVGDRPEAIALGKQLLWVANRNDGTVNRVDRATPSLVGSPIGVGGEPAGIVVGRRFVWVTNLEDGTVNRIDPATAQLVGEAIRVGDGPRGVIETPSAAWVANSKGGTVSRLDRRTGDILDTITVGKDPRELAHGFGSVWVTNRGDNTVTRIDEQTGRIDGAPIAVGERPLGIAAGAKAIWVANHDSHTVTRIQP